MHIYVNPLPPTKTDSVNEQIELLFDLINKHSDILPSSSSIVLPPAVSFTPNTLLNKMEKALPHTPNTVIQ